MACREALGRAGRGRARSRRVGHGAVEALGGYGETVTESGEIGPALGRAFDAGVPALVNVLIDPEVAYPRGTLLA